jgi:arabinofuranan 3-O-arabinosyltransferase
VTTRRIAAAQHGLLAAVAYIPLLLTAPGWVAADTKAYLYLDPGRLLSRAWSLWDPNVALGTVTHQNIGYLWPMGPWYWLFDRLGSPDWLAQRLWMGTLLFLAGAGFLWFSRVLGWGRTAPEAALAGALVFALTPYVLDYVARISVLLLPWAALPWLLGLLHRSLLTGSWRHPAAFALVVATAGGINATALVLAGVAPVLWVVFAVVVHREVAWRRALATVLRLGLLTIPVNVWWIVGLGVQSGWGLDVLRYTETVETVARSSVSSEVLRGLGYWFLYGTDKLGPWIEPGRTFTQHPWVIVLGFVLPVLAVVAATVTRWRYRAFAVTLVVAGTAMAVGTHPYDHPSPLGALFKAASASTAGLALRSTGRAVPLLVLGLALLLGAGIASLGRRRRLAAVAVGLVAILGNPPLWTGQFVGENLRRPEELPDYWTAATAALDDTSATRVLEVPGSDFATYRWGNTVDPITPGLMDRPYVARELVPFGTEASADLLIAFDRRIQEGVLDPAAVVPFARLIGAGDVVERADLQFERYRTARPQAVWQLLQAVPAGLGAATGWGSPRVAEADPRLPMHDEAWFQTRSVPPFAPVTSRAVTDPLPIVRARDATGAVILAGDGEGVVEAGAAGLLDGTGVLLSSAALADRPAVLRDAIRHGASLVVTDTNRKRAMRWGTVRDNDGYTETADETPLRHDPSDNRLPLFPAAGIDAYTTVEQRGVARVQATSYGNPVTYTAADRPANALDGDLGTAWGVGALGPVGGERLLVEASSTVTTSSVAVVQARFGTRVVTRIGVRLDGKRIGSFRLDDSSFADAGQRLDLGRARTFRTFELEVEADSVGKLAHYDDQNGVGFREVRIPGVQVDELVRLPSDLLSKAPRNRPLTLLLSRKRANPAEPFARDEEPSMARVFDLPTARSFGVAGRASVPGSLPDDQLDRLLGTTADVIARSSGRLQGALNERASAAVDGDPATVWRNSLGPQAGAWIEVERPQPVTVDHLDLQVVADGAASVPTRVTIRNEAGDRRMIDLPAIADGTEPGHTVAVPARFAGLTGRVLRLTVDAVRPVTTVDWFSKKPIELPVAIAELGLPAQVHRAAAIPTACRDDLLTIDGTPVPIQISGRADDPRGLLVTQCRGPVDLDAGEHVLRSAAGADVALDRLLLSDDGNRADAILPVDPSGPRAAAGSTVTVETSSRTAMRVRVTAPRPVWLVLGQSNSDGWHATAKGRDLGRPVLVDGYANGWLIQPDGDGSVEVQLRWTPERFVLGGLAVSGVGALVCMAILLGALLRRGRLPVMELAPMPTRRRPLLASGPAPRWRSTIATALAFGLVAGLAVSPLVGIGAAIAAVVALRHPAGRAVGLAGAALIAASGVFTAAIQVRRRLVPDFGWTDYLQPAHVLAWCGLVLLALMLVVDWRRRR